MRQPSTNKEATNKEAASNSHVIGSLAPGARIAIVRLRSMGDCVLGTPAVRLLKAHRPDLRIGVVVEDRFADIYRGNPDVDAVLPPHIRELRAFAPNLCLNLHGGARSARLTALSGAKIRAGFDIFRSSWIYTHRLPTAQKTLGITRRVHTAEHAASAVFALGVPVSDVPRARIPVPPARSPLAPSAAYALIHPLAALPEKTWPASSFCSLAERIGLTPVFIGGPGEELSAFAKWQTISGAPLREIAQLARDASLFIGNDSGPAHLAAAFGVPEVILFGPSDAEIWSPWRTEARVIQRMPMQSITVDEVAAAVREVSMVAQ